MPRECFIMSDGNLLLFGLCMNRISCVSITCYTLLKQTIFVGSFHVLKRLCYRGNKLTLYEDDFQNSYNKCDVTSHVFPYSIICIKLKTFIHNHIFLSKV